MRSLLVVIGEVVHFVFPSRYLNQGLMKSISCDNYRTEHVVEWESSGTLTGVVDEANIVGIKAGAGYNNISLCLSGKPPLKKMRMLHVSVKLRL